MLSKLSKLKHAQVKQGVQVKQEVAEDAGPREQENATAAEVSQNRDNSDLKVKEELILSIDHLSDSDSDQIIEVLHQINSQYEASIQNVRQTLLGLNVAPDQLSDGTRKLVQAACKCNALAAEQPCLSDDLKQAQQAKEAASIKTALGDVFANNVEAEETVVMLRREFEEAHKALQAFRNDSSNAHQMKTYKHKVKKNMEVISQYQSNLNSLGITDMGLYESVLNKFEEVKVVKSEVEKLSGKLEKYDNLPPTLNEAEKMLLKAKEEHDQLGQELKKIVYSDLKTFNNN